jgi:hypothetical protein
MARILLVGIEPDEVDFSDPALTPGLDAAAIRRGIALSMAGLAAAGHEARQLYVSAAPERALPVFVAALAEGRFDCVIIGGGVSHPPANRPLFEAMLNAVVRQTPAPAIGLISRPQDAVEAAARVLSA